MPTIKAADFKPLHNYVFVHELDRGALMTAGGVIIPDDDMKTHGIRPRWCKVWAVGPDVEDVKPGEWLLVEHGRWTNNIDLELDSGTFKVWRIDYPAAVLLVSDDDPRGHEALPPAPKKIHIPMVG